MNKELLGFLFKLFLLTITLYFTCEFALKSNNMNTHISVVSVIAVAVIVCILFLIFRCQKTEGISVRQSIDTFFTRDLFDFILKVILITITIYFICDFAEKSPTMNTRTSIISVMVLTIIVCVMFLIFRKDTSPSAN
jgi:membrane protein DedA with SNARE-associated domain